MSPLHVVKMFIQTGSQGRGDHWGFLKRGNVLSACTIPPPNSATKQVSFFNIGVSTCIPSEFGGFSGLQKFDIKMLTPLWFHLSHHHWLVGVMMVGVVFGGSVHVPGATFTHCVPLQPT